VCMQASYSDDVELCIDLLSMPLLSFAINVFILCVEWNPYLCLLSLPCIAANIARPVDPAGLYFWSGEFVYVGMCDSV